MAKVSPAEVEKFLKGVDFPAKKDDLVKHVKQESQQVLEVLQKLPNETFNKPTDVAKAIGEVARESKLTVVRRRVRASPDRSQRGL
ncbi:MAG TPA: DUF2795 domain-containing protein [Ktedonobacteraceae bacterium]|jgi:hypothetical protein|nr:DUF2795 domain-containing protein [Ktedonobacteraceae bacterium]